MATPTQENLGTMDYSYLGIPFVNVESKTGQNTNSLDFSYLGLPFVGAQVGAAPVTFDTSRMFIIF